MTSEPQKRPDRGTEDQPFVEMEASLEKAGRVEDLIRLYESRSREVSSNEEAGNLLARAGELARDRVKNQARAEDLFRRALAYAPESADALGGLRTLYEQRTDHASLADVLERMGSCVKGPESAALFLRASELHEQKLGRPDRAVLCLQKATRAEPRERQAYQRIRRIYLSEAKSTAVFESLEHERTALGGAGLVEEYLALAEGLVDDPAQHALASRALAVALTLEPKSTRAEKIQKGIDTLEKGWRDRVRALRGASLEERNTKNAARLSLLVAKLYAFYEPGAAPKLKDALDRCFLLWAAMPEALSLLESMAEKSGDHAGCAEKMEKLAGEAKDRGAQAELWLRLGTLRLTRLSDQPGALAAFEKAALADPSRADATSLAAEQLLEAGRAPEGLSILEKHLATLKEKPAQVSLHLRLADLYLLIQDATAARGHLEAGFKIDPGNALAAFRLAQLWTDEGKLAEAEAVLELAVCAARPVGEKVALCEVLALALDEAGEPQKAFLALAQALSLEPARPNLLTSVLDAGRRAGSEAALVTLLRRAAPLAPPETALAIWRAVAELYTAPLARPADAEAAWQEVLRRAPADEAATQALAGLKSAGPAPQDPAAALESEARRLEATAAEPAAAAAVYRQLLALRPDDASALKRLGAACAAMSQWEEVASVAERLMALAATQPERQEWRARLAQLFAERLNRKDEAARLYLSLLSEGNSSGAVLTGLERLASQGVRQGEISQALAPHYARGGDWQRQVASLLVQLSTVQDKAEQKRLLTLLAETSERHLADSRAAFEFRLRGLKVDPADESFRAEAVRLGRDLKAFAELSRFLADLGAGLADPKLATTLLLEAARLAGEGGAVDEAAAALQGALGKIPDDPAILGQLVRLFLQSRRYAECEGALRRRIGVAQPEEKAGLYLQLTEVNAELARPKEAAQALEEAIKAGAGEGENLPRLCVLLEQAGKTAELSAALGRHIAIAEAAGDADLASRLALKRAQVLEASSSDRTEAVTRYAEVLQRRPSDPDALGALEQLLKDPTCRGEAARALVPAYELVKDHRKLVAALSVVADAAQDSLEKVLALRQAATVHSQHLRQPEQAFAALAGALKLAPGDAPIRTATRQAAEEADALDTYAEVLSELAETAGPLEVPLRRELAEVYEKRLNDRPGAVRELTRVLELEPKHPEALESLGRLHRAGEDWAALADALERIAAVEPDPAKKISRWREAASLQEQKLGHKPAAAANWRQIAARDPLDRDAAANLDRLYAELDKPAEQAFAIELRRNQEGQSPHGRELAFRLAGMRRSRLNDDAGALQIYRQILDEDPAHAGAREALDTWARAGTAESPAAIEILDPVLARLGQHQQRIALREALMATAAPAERGRLSSEIRAIFERDLGQPQAAFMAALKSFTDSVDREAIRPELERLARETGSFEELAEIYETCSLELKPDDVSRAGLLRRAAELREQLGQAEEAVRLWQELLSWEPQDRQALDCLGKLFERTKNAKNLSVVYARKAQLATDPAERFKLLVQAGEAYEASGDDSTAIDAFKAALAIRKAPEGMLALDRLFGRTHRFKEQADVLDQLAAASPDLESRRVHLLKRATLLEREGQLVAALSGYQSVLELAPLDSGAVAGLERLLQTEQGRSEAARLLEPIYRQQNDSKKLVEVLEVRVGVADARLRAVLLAEVATLREGLGQKALAFAARLRVFAENAEDREAREQLERLAADTASFEELAGIYEDTVEKGVTEPLAGELWRRLAVLYGERLSRLDLAARAWTEVASREPHNAEVLDALARIYRKTSAFRELAQVMRRQIALEQNPLAGVNLLFELATLAEDTLVDKALAASCYQEILERKADDPNAIKQLGRVLSETERYPELAALFGREIGLAEAKGATEEALELMVRLGRLKLQRLNDPRGALGLFQEVLRRRAAHAGAVGALEDMARSESPLRGEAATALEPVFTSGGEFLKVVQMLESRASAEPVPQEKAALLRRVAELYSNHMENPEMAFVAATRALREVPDDERSLELCLFLVDAAEAADELSALLTEVASKAADDKARASLFRALARLQVEHGEPEAAVESWKRVLEVLPSDAEALDSIGRLLAKAGKVPELLEVLRRQLNSAEEPSKRAGLLFQIGSLQQDGLKDGLGALATFRRFLELKPDDPAALERMDGLCAAQERWPELADVLARRIKLAGATPSQEEKFRLGQLREVKLLDKQGSLELYAEVLAAEPDHAGAVTRMEGLCAREPQNGPAVEVLLKAYRASGESLKLAGLLEARVGVSSDSFERKGHLQELASLRQAQEEPELAYLALWRAFKEDPNDPALRQSLEAAADAAGTYDELTVAYEEELPRIAEAADAAGVCLRMGFVFENKLEEPERATEYYEKARQLDPVDAAAKALPALDRLYGQLDRPLELSAVLEAQAVSATELSDRVGLLFRLGQLAQDRLDSPDRAAAAFELILEIDPRHLPSARLLEGLYESAGTHDKLYTILEKQRDLVTGPEKDRVMTRMAQVSATGLSNVDHSIEIYRELLQKNPRNEQATAALEALLEKGGRSEELRELLQKRLTHTVDPRELVRLNDRLGRVLYVLLRRPDEAIPYFKAALERDARHKGALEALRDIFTEAGRKEDLVIVLRRLVPLQEGAEGVKSIRIRLAEVLAEMGRREEALDAARRSLEIEPQQVEEMNRVHAVFMSLKAYGDAVRALELRSQAELALEDREAATRTLFEVAELWTGPANKPESAGGALEKLLEIDPTHRQAYEQAVALYAKVNDWRAYAQVMDRYLPHLVTDEEKVTSLRELARVQEQKLGQKDVAFLQVCRALQLNPSETSIREDVQRLAEETGSYEELAAVYEEVADALPKGPLAEQVYLGLARVHDQKLDDPAAAEAALRKILEFDPTNEQALESIADMFSRRGKDKEYVVALEQKLEAAASIERRKEILREIARVFDERIGDPQEAASALMRALDLEPDPATLDVLIGLQRRQKDWPSVASSLLRARDLAPTPEERSRIQAEVAQVHERELNDDESAIEGYRQSLEFDPANKDSLDCLERLYTKLDRPAELLAVYERQLDLSPDYRERVTVLFKSASIWEDRYQNLANADACIEGVLSMDPQNLQAIKTLERLRKAQERWDELIGVMDRHLQLLTNPTEQAELYVVMGDLFHQQLKQVDRAVTAYSQALEVDVECRPAIHALGTLYERSGNWPFALEMLQREAQVAGPTAEAVELYHRMGKINEDMLLDPGSAKSCYFEALKIDPGYLPCIRALKGIHELEKDWGSYEKALVAEAQQTEDPEAKSRAMLEVARFHAEQKEDRDESAKWFEEALRLVPDSLEAARPLADIYIAREDWERGEQMLDIVAVKMAEKAVAEQSAQLAKELCRQLYRLGYVAEKLGNKEKALGSYEKAYQLDATYLPALEGLGNLLVQAKRYDEALKVYSTILIHHREDLTDLEVVEIYSQLGDIHGLLKQNDRALNHYEKALAIDPGHDPSLRAMVRLADQAGKFDQGAEFRHKLMGVLDGDAKFEVALELGKIAREKLADAYMAIDAYLAAYKIHPDALEVMDALYVLYHDTRQGQKAAEILEKMLAQPELKEEPQKAKRVYFALAEIYRDELKEVERSVAAFNAALDLDFRFVEAFTAIEALLGREKQWKALEENYARMIQRLPQTDETHAPRMMMWRALGDLYRKVLKHPEGAVMAYQVVAAGLPDDAGVQEAYAELASSQPGHEEQAVEAYRKALPQTTNPGKVASALAELAARRKDYDSAYLAAQVVSAFIGEAGPGEREILTKLTPYAKKKEVAQRVLTDRLWQSHLFHPKVRGPISEIMAILYEQAGHLYRSELPQYGLNPKRHLIDVAGAQEYQIHHFRYVARLLGMEQVALFSPFLIATRERMAKRSSEPAPEPMLGVEICHTHPVCLKVGGKFFSETGQKEVYYLLGRTMALLRPELALAARLSADRLEAVFQAAISLSVSKFRYTADAKAIDTERRALEKTLPEQVRGALSRVTKEYVRGAGSNDLRNYLEGAELSAVRTGLFVAGEMEPVKKMVLAESGASYRVRAPSKIRDLMVFALSEDLHALRVAVGTHVEVQLRK